MRQKQPRRKGPLAKWREIAKRVAKLNAEMTLVDALPHPHAMRYAGVLLICPRDCPVDKQKAAIAVELRSLRKEQDAVLLDNLRSREKSVQRPTITREMYDEAWDKVKDERAPRRRLAEELLVTRQGLAEWEKRNLRKR